MKTTIALLTFFFSLLTSAQTKTPEQWAKDLMIDDSRQSLRLGEFVLYNWAQKPDTARMVYAALKKNYESKQTLFAESRFILARYFFMGILNPELKNTRDTVKKELNKALAIARKTGNEMMLADLCYLYAQFLGGGQLDESAFYHLKSIELVEKLGPEKFFNIYNRYRVLADLFYTTREYENSIRFARKYLQGPYDSLTLTQHKIVYNIIGLCYRKMGVQDSAIFYFDKASAAATAETNRQFGNLWITIPGGNKAQVYFQQKRYEEAKLLFWADYYECLKNKIVYDAANNLQWLAKIDLVNNKPDSALYKARDALNMLRREPQTNYLINVYETLTDIYRRRNNTDSAARYNELYTLLRDSVELMAARSQTRIVKLRLDDERNRNALNTLEKEKQNEKLKRNAFIVVVLLLSALAYLFYKRKQQKQKQEQQLRETELAAAKEQMNLFTKTIADKSELIEQLQQQMEQHKLAPELEQNLEQLKNRTILTEDDWYSFQTLFEKIHPGFFKRLKEHTPDITPAELRFAALIRLEMTNRQAASMLGISADSARKTKLRLRQRLQLPEENSLEQFIQNI